MSNQKPIQLVARPDGAALSDLTAEQLEHLGEIALKGWI